MKYSVLYLLGLALPYVHFMFLIWVVFEIFTPIMGRSGTEIPPEVVLASLVTLATIFLSSFFVSIPTCSIVLKFLTVFGLQIREPTAACARFDWQYSVDVVYALVWIFFLHSR